MYYVYHTHPINFPTSRALSRIKYRTRYECTYDHIILLQRWCDTHLLHFLYISHARSANNGIYGMSPSVHFFRSSPLTPNTLVSLGAAVSHSIQEPYTSRTQKHRFTFHLHLNSELKLLPTVDGYQRCCTEQLQQILLCN